MIKIIVMNDNTKFKIVIILIIVGLLLSHFLLARSAFIAGGKMVCKNIGNMVLVKGFECEEREKQLNEYIPQVNMSIDVYER